MYRVEYNRKYRDTHYEKELERQRRWRRETGYVKVRDPEKEKARHALRNAVVAGKIIKPSNCPDCGTTVNIHAHHEDYSKPFDVKWLCARCHGKLHRKDAVLASPEEKP